MKKERKERLMNSAGWTNQMHGSELLFAHWHFLYILVRVARAAYTCYLLSNKIKIKFLFEEVWNYAYKKCMSYKVNLIRTRIFITYKVMVVI